MTVNRLKSWILTAGALAVLCFPLARAYAQCSAPAEGVVAHWKMDDTSTTAVDSVGGNDGAMQNGLDGASNSIDGVLESALDFDAGSSHYIAPGNVLNNLEFPFTVSSWIYREATGTHAVIGTDDPGVTAGNYCGSWLTVQGEKLVAGLGECGCNHAGCHRSATSADDVPVGQWVHVAAVYRGVSDIALYVDGIDKSKSWTGTGTSYAQDGQVLRIGGLARLGGAYLDGAMDDVRIYNRGLSADEIGALYSTRSTGDVQAGYMAYDAKSAGMVYCDGTDWVHMGVGSYNPNAINPNGAYLDRSTALSGVVNDGRVTGSFWAKVDTSGGSAQQLVQSQGSDFLIQWNGAGDQMFIAARDTGGTQRIRLQSSAISDGEWHHYMFSVDANDYGSGRLYIDGVDDLQFNPDDGQAAVNFVQPDIHVLASYAGPTPLVGEIADLWVDFNTYVDLDIESNRRKFLSPAGMPMYLGQDGSIPLGSAPDLFFSGDSANWDTNKGSGGAFTLTGGTELLTASSQPGECVAEGGPFAAAGVYSTTEFVRGVWGDGEYIYVADTSGGIRAFTHDGSDFASVALDATYSVYAVSGDSTYIYTAHGPQNSISAWTFDGSTFTELDNYTTSERAYYAYSTGGYIYVLDGDEFKALSFDGSSFSLIDSYTMPQNYNSEPNIWSDGTYLYVANGNIGGVLALTFDGSDISLAGSVVPPNSAMRLFGANGYIYVAINNEGLIAYSFDGSTFTARGQIDPGDFGTAVWADENYVYLSRGDANIYAYTHDGSSFTLVDSQTATDFGRGVWGDGQYIYHATGNDGIRAYSGFTTCSCGALPNGVLAKKGHLTYDSNFNVMKYCNGAEWVAMGPTGGTPPTNGLVTYLALDETSGAGTATDSVGSNDGTLTNMTPADDWVEGVLANGLSFGGDANERLTIANDASLDIATGSWSFWYKVGGMWNTDGTDGSDAAALMSRADASGLNSGIAIAVSPYSRWLGLSMKNSGGTNVCALNGTVGPDGLDSEWRHVVVNYSQASGENAALYIDGILNDTCTNSAAWAFNGQDMLLADSAGTWHEEFLGTIDDVRIYNRHLTESEVHQLYNFGLSGGLGNVSGNCSNPSRPEGNMLYATDNNVMQYCNGENWIGIGQ